MRRVAATRERWLAENRMVTETSTRCRAASWKQEGGGDRDSGEVAGIGSGSRV